MIAITFINNWVRYSRKYLLQGANLRGANLWGANLREANLRGADLNSTIGNMEEILSIQFEIWQITIDVNNKIMQIGCQNHSIEKWFEFNETEIDDMGINALTWWYKYKEVLKSILEVKGIL